MSGYPAYVERMLSGSAVFRSNGESLGVLQLTEDLETIVFESSTTEVTLCLDDVATVEVDPQSLVVRLALKAGGSMVAFEFPDSVIYGDWSYGLQVLTVHEDQEATTDDELMTLLEEATALNAALLDDNIKLVQAVSDRDCFIQHLLKTQSSEKPHSFLTEWEPLEKAAKTMLYSARDA
jgi:hypothetical protein